MIIDVNPQTITGIAQTIANAYGEVEEAARILTSITEHNNWNCKEGMLSMTIPVQMPRRF